MRGSESTREMSQLTLREKGKVWLNKPERYDHFEATITVLSHAGSRPVHPAYRTFCRIMSYYPFRAEVN